MAIKNSKHKPDPKKSTTDNSADKIAPAAPSPRELAQAGGNARASKLSPERRSEIASRASTARWRLAAPIKATHAGTIEIGDTKLECANLPDGRRVLTEAAVMGALGRGYSGYYSQRDAAAEAGTLVLPRYLAPAVLQPLINDNDELQEMLAQPIPYISPKAKGRSVAKGVNADALPMICEVWLKARDGGLLKEEAQILTAKKADLLMRGLARVGIAALIDEATGAQEQRNKEALQAVLDRFLVKELAEWAKRFPDDFYFHIFRLRGWQWKGRSVNPPQVLAHYTKDLVYARLAPGVAKEMQERTPKDSGIRWHQWLSKEGCDALQAHFFRLIALMTAARTWDEMMELVSRALPKQKDTMALPFMANDEPTPAP